MQTTHPELVTEDSFRRQMAEFFDTTSDGIIFLDRGYNFTFVNRRASELLAPSGKILGTNLFDTFPAVLDPESPVAASFQLSMQGDHPPEFETFYPDPLNQWFRIQSYPAENGIMIFFREITHEKLTVDELRIKNSETERQRAEIESVYRTAPIGLALFDLPDYRYVRLNDRQAAFFGLKPEQIVGRTLTEMAPIDGLKELFDQVLEGKPVVNYPLEGTLITDPNDYRYWTVSYFPVFNSDGKIQAITAASLEITQQKKAEQALIQSEKLAVVGRLASSIAHEINNPLESVTNLLYLARNSSTLDEAREHLDAAEIELRRVSAITSQTLRFHKQATSPQAVTPEQLIQSVLQVYHGRIANSRVAIFQRHHGSSALRCFEGEIRQVISNLVSNALDAIGQQGGKLIFRSRPATNWRNREPGIIITIADDGCGMNTQTLSKLFDPFFTTKSVTGTGLGLWVSKEIIGRHRGFLRVRSSQHSAHHGTVFNLFLPIDAVVRQQP